MNPKALLNGLLISIPLWAVIFGTPYYFYQKNQNKIEAKAELRNRKIEDVPSQPWAIMLPHNQTEVNAKRTALIRLIFGTDTLPSQKDIERTSTGFIVHQPLGIDSVVEYHKKSNRCLAIYHVGHANPGDHAEAPDIFGDCSVLVFDMPLLGRNPQPMVTNHHGTYRLTSHDMLNTIESPVHPLYYFVNPINQVLNYVLSETPYKKVIMAGHSGGGWETTLYAAMDTRIQFSLPIAGSLPIFLLAVPPRAEPGDFEQHNPDLLNIVSYLDLYVMATDGGRKQLQLLNRLDDQAFSGEASKVYVKETSKASSELGGEWNQYMDMTSRHHEIQPPMKQKLIKDISSYILNN